MREVRIKLVSKDPIVDYPVTKPEDTIVLMQEIIGDMADEFFAAVYLNTKNKPLDFMIAGIGGVDRAAIEPSSVLKGALLQNASRIMLFHNHPSGELQPSIADLEATERFVLTGKLHQIEILDHVIVTGESFYSFRQHNLIELTDRKYMKGLRELKSMSVEEYNEKYAFRTEDYYRDVDDSLSI